jgi:pentapeptide repeat protein
MADEEQLKILRQGVATWNEWREKNPELLRPDLSSADLSRAGLCGVNLKDANLSRANLEEANLREANLFGAKLGDANLVRANLSGANLNWAKLIRARLSFADLRGANLFRADLSEADFWGADLSRASLIRANLARANLEAADLVEANLREANLSRAQLIETNLRDATLTGSFVYGVSVWAIEVNDRTKQKNLIITDPHDPTITVDNLKVAQFIHLLLNNQEIREVIDTITSKAVLILGRFSDQRKPVLDAIRDELRKPEHNYLPIVFDFSPSPNQATLETVKTLASLARFVIADLTDARSVLMELGAIVPAFPSVAVRLLLKKSEHEYGMLDSIRLYRSVVENTYLYEDVEEVIASIKENIIAPAEAKVEALRPLIRPATR